jgi:hypothetical protein
VRSPGTSLSEVACFMTFSRAIVTAWLEHVDQLRDLFRFSSGEFIQLLALSPPHHR